MFVYRFQQEFNVNRLKATEKVGGVSVLVHVEDVKPLALDLGQLLDGAGLACACLADQEERFLSLESNTDLLHETESCRSVDEALIWLSKRDLSRHRLTPTEIEGVITNAKVSSVLRTEVMEYVW